ncbi:MAG: NifU family protein [Candidatus Latescibacteria bacterium]|nr:NifU family protein [Candidatus Latescibacterota bacterium]NIM64521.1 NifU family protein [Candidatus Latescibacterota bacterium]NIO00674.1 NifU family protein [Candidatus Latescibacterota bacterium]NIO27077.1 NifU family protein [Candidatus Latescibacterota bacterium]NIO54601.1 NifU family protein [Candidatus Latescibacterota bacterium]
MRDRVIDVLDEIRPAIQMDGGDVELVDVVDGVVQVRLLGACRGCPMSQATLSSGIEDVIKRKVPEVIRVEAVP